MLISHRSGNIEIITTIDNGSTHYHENDYQGKAIRLTNQSGKTLWHGDWEPYSESDDTRVTIMQVKNLQRFAGQILETRTGLYYNHFRECDPEMDRYTQSDPMGLNGGINTYAYVGGIPVMFVDPLGLESADCKMARELLGVETAKCKVKKAGGGSKIAKDGLKEIGCKFSEEIILSAIPVAKIVKKLFQCRVKYLRLRISLIPKK